ncbi:ferredoxin [Mycobacterium deserti]|uniref:ferredoxin n=1 Tax=Mycobacterium deserti TaxID=2978347 RepID=UPI0036F3963F
MIADRALCEGHGLCQQVAPQIYSLDEEGTVHVELDRIDEGLRTSAIDGAQACPVAALTVTALPGSSE